MDFTNLKKHVDSQGEMVLLLGQARDLLGKLSSRVHTLSTEKQTRELDLYNARQGEKAALSCQTDLETTRKLLNAEENEKARLEQVLWEKEKELQTALRDNDAYCSDYRVLNDEVERIKEEVARLGDELKLAQDEMKRFEDEVERLKTENGKLENECSSLKEQNQALSCQLEKNLKQDTAKDSLVKDITKYMGELRSAVKEFDAENHTYAGLLADIIDEMEVAFGKEEWERMKSKANSFGGTCIDAEKKIGRETPALTTVKAKSSSLVFFLEQIVGQL